jgi:drug/metabolite transporter (DMT)-like permease
MRLAAPTASATSRGILLMLPAILIFTSMDALAKGLVSRYPAPQVVSARFAGQLPLVAVILGPRLGAAMRTRFPGTHVWRSATQLGATSLFFLSLNHTRLAGATALTDTDPVLIPLGTTLFAGERLTLPRLIGVLGAGAQLCLIRAFSLAEASVGAPLPIPASSLPRAGASGFMANTRTAGP